jgi:Mg2+/Co2+ transporter CorB
MDWNLPDDEATTIAGLVIHEARTIPDQGTAFNFHGFRFQVLRKAKNRITTLRITPLTAIGVQTSAPAEAQRGAV